MPLFRMSLSNWRKGFESFGQQLTPARRTRVAKVLGHARAFAALRAAVRELALEKGKKFGSLQDFIAFLLEHQEEIIALIQAIMLLFGL